MDFKNIADLLRLWTKKHPNKKLLFFEGEWLTYKQVDEKSDLIASVLMKHGLEKGDRACVMLGNSPEFVISLFAVAKCGAVFIPMNTFFKRDEAQYIVSDSESKVVVTSEQFKNVISGFDKEIETLENIFTFNNAGFGTDLDEEIKNTKLPEKWVEVDKDDLAFFIYSSGTTGHPKGAMLTGGNLIANAHGAGLRFEVKSKDRFLLFLPAFHTYTLMACIIVPLFFGISIIILEGVSDLKKKSFKKILIRQRPTVFLGVPQVFTALLKSKMPWWFIRFLYPFRMHLSGGAPLPEETLNAFIKKFRVPIIEGYGLSEASPVLSINSLKKQKALSVGPALDNVEVKIVDENEMEVPQGEVGELIAKGPNIMSGYWNMPGLTDETIRNGWLFTGDYAKIDEEGYIYIVDRKKDLIIIKGINVYPREIEEVLHKFEGVEAAAVIGIKDENSGEIPVAYIKPQENFEVDLKKLKNYLKDHLANYKIPKHFYLKNDLPMTATGKILKRELRKEVLGE